MIIRSAISTDLTAIIHLCEELGYPTTMDRLKPKFEKIVQDPAQAVFVAEFSETGVAGWIHVMSVSSLISEHGARIGGLVVDSKFRGQGIGKALLAKVEAWCREKKIESVFFTSNIVREEAHRLYLRLGYEITKTSYQFRKLLK